MRPLIRRAKPGDEGAFLDLVRALAKFESLEPPSPTAARRLVRDIFSEKRKLDLLLTFHKGRAVAYALYFFTYSSFLALPTLYLEDIFVLEEFRGGGIGKALFLRLAKEARKKGCGRMEWAVLTWNKNAIGFYERMGARKLAEWDYYRLNRNEIERLSR